MQSRTNHRFDPFGPEAANFPDSGGLNLDDIDFKDPLSFFKALNDGKSGLPMPDLMEPAQVRQLCKKRSSGIMASHDRLRAILSRHEPTIHKRWTKKTKHQRLQILQDGWPNMATTHRPDFYAFRRESEAQRDAGTRFRDSFMWPYVNQEDLLRPKSLLLMLKSRGRHQPCDFAAADGEAMYLGRVTKAIVPIFLNCYVVTLNGMTLPGDYGKLVAWEDHEDAFEWMHTRKQFLPGEALDILEAQDRLLRFLIHCCEQVLHDIPAAELLSNKYPVQPEPTLKLGLDSNGFDSLAVIAEEAPYRPPGGLDFGRIESLLAARSSAAEDQYVRSLLRHLPRALRMASANWFSFTVFGHFGKTLVTSLTSCWSTRSIGRRCSRILTANLIRSCPGSISVFSGNVSLATSCLARTSSSKSFLSCGARQKS